MAHPAHHANDKPPFQPYLWPMKRQHHTRPAPHPRQLHDEAFDLYCAGLSCPQVGAALRKRHGAGAPHGSTIKRWMERGRWTAQEAAK